MNGDLNNAFKEEINFRGLLTGFVNHLMLHPPDLDLQDFSGTLDLQYNLIGDKGNATLEEAPPGAPDANGNLIGGPVGGAIDPRRGPLTDNGGSTWTHALLADSPAIDRGDPTAVAGVDGVPLFDQRGQPYARVVNGRIDMGAHERQSLTATIVSVPSPALTPVDAVAIHFSQPVSGFDLSDLTLSRNGLMGNLLTGDERLESTDGQTYVLSGLRPPRPRRRPSRRACRA